MIFAQFFQAAQAIGEKIKRGMTAKYKVEIKTFENNVPGEVQKQITFLARHSTDKINSIQINGFNPHFILSPTAPCDAIQFQLRFSSSDAISEFKKDCSESINELFNAFPLEQNGNSYIIQAYTDNADIASHLLYCINRHDAFDMSAIQILIDHLELGVHQAFISDENKALIDNAKDIPANLEKAKPAAKIQYGAI